VFTVMGSYKKAAGSIPVINTMLELKIIFLAYIGCFQILLLNRVRFVAKFHFHKQQESSPTFTIQIVYTSSTSIYLFIFSHDRWNCDQWSQFCHDLKVISLVPKD